MEIYELTVHELMDKLEKKGIISKQMCEKAKEKINHINVVELFYFTKQKNQFKKKDNRYQKVGYQNGQFDNYNNSHQHPSCEVLFQAPKTQN